MYLAYCVYKQSADCAPSAVNKQSADCAPSAVNKQSADCGPSAVNKQRVGSIHPIDQPVENIMSYIECVAEICSAYVVLLNSRQKWRNRIYLQTKQFISEGMRYGENLLTDVKLEDKVGFQSLVSVTPIFSVATNDWSVWTVCKQSTNTN
jgi:hypothetical protein